MRGSRDVRAVDCNAEQLLNNLRLCKLVEEGCAAVQLDTRCGKLLEASF